MNYRKSFLERLEDYFLEGSILGGFFKFVFLIFAFALLVVAVYDIYRSNVTTRPGYSEGIRSGILTKYSVKGWKYKTGEGELTLDRLISRNNGNSVENEVFRFSDPQNRNWEQFLGKRVRVHYKQNYTTNFKDGKTDYMVVDIKLVE